MSFFFCCCSSVGKVSGHLFSRTTKAWFTTDGAATQRFPWLLPNPLWPLCNHKVKKLSSDLDTCSGLCSHWSTCTNQVLNWFPTLHLDPTEVFRRAACERQNSRRRRFFWGKQWRGWVMRSQRGGAWCNIMLDSQASSTCRAALFQLLICSN